MGRSAKQCNQGERRHNQRKQVADGHADSQCGGGFVAFVYIFAPDEKGDEETPGSGSLTSRLSIIRNFQLDWEQVHPVYGKREPGCLLLHGSARRSQSATNKEADKRKGLAIPKTKLREMY